MKLIKIFMVSYFFPPTGGISCQRILRFARNLPKFGFAPKIYTASGNARWWVIDETLIAKTNTLDIVKVADNLDDYYSQPHFTKNLLSIKRAFSAILHLDPMFSWAQNVINQLVKDIPHEKPDILFITIPPFSSIGIANAIKKLFPNLPIILDMRDMLWMFNPYGSMPRKVANFVQKRRAESLVQNWLLHVDGITVPSNFFAKSLKELSHIAPMEIPTPFERSDYENLPQYLRGERFRLLHSGSFHRHVEPQTLTNFLCLLPDDILKSTDIILQGNISPADARRFTDFPNIQLLPHVPHATALTAQKNSDANLVLLSTPADKGGDEIIPGKTFDYIGAQRPIFVVAPKDGALYSLIEHNRLGYSAPLDQPELAAGIFSKIFRLWQAKKLDPIPDKYAEFFETAHVIEKLANFLKPFAN